ncbi:MAG: carboxypeptidase-like regulatory domain-containing protein, partial [Rhodothermales bacterium]
MHQYSIRSLVLALLLPLLLAFSDAQAQEASISGFVRDAETGETLLLANVRIKDTLIGTATNNSGYYTLAGLEPGEYTLQFSYIGYQ